MTPLFIIFLLPLAFAPLTKAETHAVWSFDWEGIDVRVYAPYQAYAGETITIKVRVEAKEDIRDVYVKVWLYGSKLDGYDRWTRYVGVLSDVDLSGGVVREQEFNVTIPSDVSLGLIYGHAYCDWKVWKLIVWSDRSYDDSFTVTYLKSKAYEYLQSDYNDLLADFDDLQSDYNTLEERYNNLKLEYDESTANLGSTRNLNYALITTTIVFIVTTVYLAIRRTTVKPEPKTT